MNFRKYLLTTVFTSAALVAAANAPAENQVNGSGATLFVSFFDFGGITNDQIDVDGDGRFEFNSGSPDQLATSLSTLMSGGASSLPANLNTITATSGAGNTYWFQHYRSIGSGNGFQEFVDYQLYNARVEASQSTKAKQYSMPHTNPSEAGALNQIRYRNPGETAYSDDGNGSTDTPLNYNQQTVDYGNMDVPALWFVTNPSSGGAWNAKPGASGYGNNPLASDTNFSNKLKNLFDPDHDGNTATAEDLPAGWDNTGSGPYAGDDINYGTLNFDGSDPNRQIFETAINQSPITYIANRGTGVSQITQNDMEYLMTTGRMPDGTNLVGVTRDSGSGTRNGMMNTTGIDPSWGRGDNNGSGNMESTVQNHRLAVGYTGLLGSGRAIADHNAGLYEVPSFSFGGTNFVRPDTIQKLLNTDETDVGYSLGGLQTIATIGDPLAGDIYVAGRALATGEGFTQNYAQGEIVSNASDIALLDTVAFDAGGPGNVPGDGTGSWDYVKHAGNGSGNPEMDNKQAALFIRNIVGSLALFDSPDSVDNALAMPGEVIIENFLPPASVDAVPQLTDPTDYSDTSYANPTAQATSIAASNLGTTPATTLGAWGTHSGGLVPNRKTSTTYSDANTGSHYKTFDGTNLNYGAVLAVGVNEVAGDFNGDNLRNASDVAGMMLAWRARYNSESYITLGLSGSMSPEIIADFDGDGNFDSEDVRYFADGLYTSSPLDRKAGFTAVDTEWDKEDDGLVNDSQTNFFNIAAYTTGESYKDGDARADIAGSAGGPSMGWAPVGADGLINALDIDYVYAQFNNNALLGAVTGDTAFPDAEANWSDIDDAVFFDLSADLTGDLIVNQLDIDEIVQLILGTDYGDVDLDGDIDDDDQLIVDNNQGNDDLGWAGGDINGDGTTDALDLDYFGSPCVLGDTDGDADVDFDDFLAVQNFFGTAPPGINAVPEPASLALLCLGGLLILTRRRTA